MKTRLALEWALPKFKVKSYKANKPNKTPGEIQTLFSAWRKTQTLMTVGTTKFKRRKEKIRSLSHLR